MTIDRLKLESKKTIEPPAYLESLKQQEKSYEIAVNNDPKDGDDKNNSIKNNYYIDIEKQRLIELKLIHSSDAIITSEFPATLPAIQSNKCDNIIKKLNEKIFFTLNLSENESIKIDTSLFEILNAFCNFAKEQQLSDFKVKIVGSSVYYFMEKTFFKQELLNVEKQLEPILNEQILSSFEVEPSDIDVRIYCDNITEKQIELFNYVFSSFIYKKVFFILKFNEYGITIDENTLFSYLPKGIIFNIGYIVYSITRIDTNKIPLEILAVKQLQREYLFSQDALCIDITSLFSSSSPSKNIFLLSNIDGYNPWQSIIDRLLKIIRTNHFQSLDGYAWATYLVCLSKGYRNIQPELEDALAKNLNSIINKNPVRQIRKLLQKGLKNHCQNNISLFFALSYFVSAMLKKYCAGDNQFSSLQKINIPLVLLSLIKKNKLQLSSSDNSKDISITHMLNELMFTQLANENNKTKKNIYLVEITDLIFQLADFFQCSEKTKSYSITHTEHNQKKHLAIHLCQSLEAIHQNIHLLVPYKKQQNLAEDIKNSESWLLDDFVDIKIVKKILIYVLTPSHLTFINKSISDNKQWIDTGLYLIEKSHELLQWLGCRILIENFSFLDAESIKKILVLLASFSTNASADEINMWQCLSQMILQKETNEEITNKKNSFFCDIKDILLLSEIIVSRNILSALYGMWNDLENPVKLSIGKKLVFNLLEKQPHLSLKIFKQIKEKVEFDEKENTLLINHLYKLLKNQKLNAISMMKTIYELLIDRLYSSCEDYSTELWSERIRDLLISLLINKQIVQAFLLFEYSLTIHTWKDRPISLNNILKEIFSHADTQERILLWNLLFTYGYWNELKEFAEWNNRLFTFLQNGVLFFSRHENRSLLGNIIKAIDILSLQEDEQKNLMLLLNNYFQDTLPKDIEEKIESSISSSKSLSLSLSEYYIRKKNHFKIIELYKKSSSQFLPIYHDYFDALFDDFIKAEFLIQNYHVLYKLLASNALSSWSKLHPQKAFISCLKVYETMSNINNAPSTILTDLFKTSLQIYDTYKNVMKVSNTDLEQFCKLSLCIFDNLWSQQVHLEKNLQKLLENNFDLFINAFTIQSNKNNCYCLVLTYQKLKLSSEQQTEFTEFILNTIDSLQNENFVSLQQIQTAEELLKLLPKDFKPNAIYETTIKKIIAFYFKEKNFDKGIFWLTKYCQLEDKSTLEASNELITLILQLLKEKFTKNTIELLSKIKKVSYDCSLKLWLFIEQELCTASSLTLLHVNYLKILHDITHVNQLTPSVFDKIIELITKDSTTEKIQNFLKIITIFPIIESFWMKIFDLNLKKSTIEIKSICKLFLTYCEKEKNISSVLEMKFLQFLNSFKPKPIIEFLRSLSFDCNRYKIIGNEREALQLFSALLIDGIEELKNDNLHIQNFLLSSYRNLYRFLTNESPFLAPVKLDFYFYPLLIKNGKKEDIEMIIDNLPSLFIISDNDRHKKEIITLILQHLTHTYITSPINPDLIKWSLNISKLLRSHKYFEISPLPILQILTHSTLPIVLAEAILFFQSYLDNSNSIKEIVKTIPLLMGFVIKLNKINYSESALILIQHKILTSQELSETIKNIIEHTLIQTMLSYSEKNKKLDFSELINFIFTKPISCLVKLNLRTEIMLPLVNILVKKFLGIETQTEFSTWRETLFQKCKSILSSGINITNNSRKKIDKNKKNFKTDIEVNDLEMYYDILILRASFEKKIKVDPKSDKKIINFLYDYCHELIKKIISSCNQNTHYLRLCLECLLSFEQINFIYDWEHYNQHQKNSLQLIQIIISKKLYKQHIETFFESVCFLDLNPHIEKEFDKIIENNIEFSKELVKIPERTSHELKIGLFYSKIIKNENMYVFSHALDFILKWNSEDYEIYNNLICAMCEEISERYHNYPELIKSNYAKLMKIILDNCTCLKNFPLLPISTQRSFFNVFNKVIGSFFDIYSNENKWEIENENSPFLMLETLIQQLHGCAIASLQIDKNEDFINKFLSIIPQLSEVKNGLTQLVNSFYLLYLSPIAFHCSSKKESLLNSLIDSIEKKAPEIALDSEFSKLIEEIREKIIPKK